MQPNYNKRPLKRQYQKFFFDRAKTKQIFIGLCGPTPKGYLRTIYNAGFKHIILLDLDKANLENNSKLVEEYKKKGVRVEFNNENINHVLSTNPNVFFDLDYCNNINTISEYLPQIAKLNEFTFTVSVRGKKAGEDEILNKIFSFNRYFKQRRYRGSREVQLMMMFYFPPK